MKIEKNVNADNTYSVYSADEVVGIVRRLDTWTVRGTRKTWQALRNGRVIQGGFQSRRDAASYLVNR